MGDRVAVMRAGTLQQVDTPEHVYRRPANRFVAGFIGSPSMNMVEAQLTRANGELTARFGEHSLAIDDRLVTERPALLAYEDRDVILGIRPEDMEDAAFATEEGPGRTLAAVCKLTETLGSEVLVHFPVVAGGADEFAESLEDTTSVFVARVSPDTAARAGEPLRLVVDTKRLHFFDPESGLAI
jgi:multiple sugar transport system ATP-binding protein